MRGCRLFIARKDGKDGEKKELDLDITENLMQNFRIMAVPPARVGRSSRMML